MFYTCRDSSRSTWSYSLNDTQKIIDVTASKQWIHFFRSERWPPTSNILFLQINQLACCIVIIVLHSWVLYSLNVQLTHFKPRFCNACSFGSCTQYVLLTRNIIWFSYPFGILEKAMSNFSIVNYFYPCLFTALALFFAKNILGCRVHEIEIASVLFIKELCHYIVSPYTANGCWQLGSHNTTYSMALLDALSVIL